MADLEEVAQTGARTARLESRVTPEIKALIERAASLQGLNTTDFLVAHGAKAARETINQIEGTVLRPEDRDSFMRAFDDAAPNRELVELMRLRARVAAQR
ncbi:MAG TPA: DUF1778 domain-containing protein [Stellaceae bacterium]|nr:DUF1778 domain-containing protein [Stellaceae bacterium]